MTRDRKILALLALLALVSLSCTALSRLFRAAPESGTLPGAEAPATVAPEPILPVSTEVRRLELAPSPTPFHVTGPDDVRSILDLGRPDGTDYFDVPDNWYDYDTPGYAAYRVEDSHLFGIDYNPSDRPIYWSYTNVSSGNTYAEITATNGDCVGRDAVGLVIRVRPKGDTQRLFARGRLCGRIPLPQPAQQEARRRPDRLDRLGCHPHRQGCRQSTWHLGISGALRRLHQRHAGGRVHRPRL